MSIGKRRKARAYLDKLGQPDK